MNTEFTVRCGECGDELEAQWVRSGSDTPILDVTPCEKCLDKATSEGYKQGEKDGDNAERL